MVNLRAVYAHAEEHTTAYLFGLFALLTVCVVAQSLVSPFAIPALVIAVAFLIMSVRRPLWTLGFLAVWLPLESFALKFVPDDIYVFARYFSEGLVYLLCAIVLWRVISGNVKLRQTPIDLPIALFIVVLLASTIVNLVSPTVAVLGARQILRFILIFFVVVYLHPSRSFIRTMTAVMLAVLVVESGIGLLQPVVGEPLDQFLLPSEARTYGDLTLTAGVQQTWDYGSRIFATFGRYDRLGNFLYFFLLIAVGLLYEPSVRKGRRELWWVFALGLPALLLTYSRASWFAFLLGFLFIGVWIKRDRRVLVAFLSFVIFVASYLAVSGLNVRFITEAPGQTLVERFYESFSYARWRGEYVGFGRVFWFVQTPLTVVPASPIFGFGPGQYGGGAVAALGNTIVYEKLGLPFGTFGTDGFIDNNWFSLWGETGTLGVAFYLWAYAALFVAAVRLYRRSDDPFVRAVAIGYAAALLGVAFNAFTSLILETRTVAFYLWMYGGFIIVLTEPKTTRHLPTT